MRAQFLLIIAVLVPASAGATAITIDGKYADWANVTTFTDANDNQNNDIKSFAITDNLGADGKADKTDLLYIKLEFWATSGNGAAQSIIFKYPDGTTDTFTVRLNSVTESSCAAAANNCVTFKQTTDNNTGVITWEMSVAFGDLSKSFAPAYTLKAFVSAKGAADRLPNADTKTIGYNANTDVATSAQIVSQRADAQAGWGTMVRWQTGAEVENAGFVVWKRQGAHRVPVSGLVPATGAGGRGAAYEIFDGGGKPGDVYLIEDIDDRGLHTLHPPFQAGLNGPVLDASPLLPSLLGSPALGRKAPVIRLAPSPKAAPAPSYGAAVLSAGSEGIYAVDPQDLIGAGLDPAAVAKGRVSLSRGGRWVNLVATPATGRKMLFYSPAPQNPYDGFDRYRAQPGPPVQPASERLLPPWGAPLASFVSTVVARELHEYDWYQGGADPYAWVLIRPSARAVVNLRLPDPAPGAAGSLFVHLTGGKPYDHAYDVVLNGVVLGTAIWSARDVYQGRFGIPGGLLDPGGRNVLEVRAQDGVSPADYVYLHDLAATYDRAFVADGDELSFEAPSGRTVLLGGFSGPDIVLLDVTDPRSPRALDVQPFADGAGGFSVAFRDTAGGVVRYRAATTAALRRPNLRASQDRLLRERPGADLLVVVSDEMKPGLDAYLAARRAQGWRVEVVTTSEVYDAYAGGDAGPDALSALVRDAVDHWLPAPRFLLLAGQGSMDPRGLLGGTDKEQVPALFTVTRDYHLRAPSDVGYVLEEGVVRMAVGRIPARSAGELSATLAKILIQENRAPSRSSLMVVDGPHDGDAFRSVGVTLAAQIPGGASLLDAGLSPDPAADLRAAMPGQDLVTYVGHAWTGGWGGGATLLDGAGAASIAGGRTPFVMTSTCWESNFTDPWRQSVSLNLLLDPRGGSSGSFGPTTILSLTDHERLVAEALAAAGGSPTIGQAVQRAEQGYLDLQSDRPDPALTFVLLGDPTMRSPVGP